MTRKVSPFPLSPRARRLIRSYGLIAVIAIAFTLMAMFIREKPTTVPVDSMPARSEVATWH